jgi:FkbH-like protein
MNPADYFRQAHEIKATWQTETDYATLAILSSSTLNFLEPFIIVAGEQLGCPLKPWFAPFNTFEQLLLNDNSALWEQQPAVIWLALRLEEADGALLTDFAGIGPEEAAARLAEICRRLVHLARAARERSRASILVSNLCLSTARLFDIFDSSNPDGLGHLLAEANRHLARELAALPDTHIFDYAGLVAEEGRNHWSDPRLWYMARAGLSAAVQPAFGRRLARSVAALLRPAAKCLVLDLDNTLWGGVIGDDGLEGIQLGDDYPGNLYKDFQRALLSLRRRGFLLAVASKNDEAAVLEALNTHPEMILRAEHFAAIYANWEPKPANLRRIAAALNIGLDALIFIDDNPVERAQVREALPMVEVVELPAKPIGYLETLGEVARLDRPRLLAEDRGRAALYQQEQQRQALRQSAAGIEDFWCDLEMVATVGLCDEVNLNRVAQLIQKTNQFNLTTRRHKLDDVRCLMASEAAEVAWLRLADRFGDAGLVCVGIIRAVEPAVWEIDTFLMSCRVMGRQVETAFLAYLAELAAKRGATSLRGLYCPTPKNQITHQFYPEHGFMEVGQVEKAGTVFEISLPSDTLVWPEVIKWAAGAD